MANPTLDPSTLRAFENAAAGHDGVLSDPTGALIVKPCVPAEIAFYKAASTSHRALAAYMPNFIGTLDLSDPSSALTPVVTAIPETSNNIGTAATLALNDVGPMHGKKLETSTSIVLQNVAAGFRKPNILDLKLGARLYDDDTDEAKRVRLDKVAAETTSGSLGFRIAGMRIWQGEQALEPGATDKFTSVDAGSRYKTYNKLYGRIFTAENVVEAFKEYFLVPAAGVSANLASTIITHLLKDVRGVQAALEVEESRMYSASLLFVYEGDGSAAKELAEALAKVEDSTVEGPKLAAMKLIDFAHATFQPHTGPDENALAGIRSIARILEGLQADLS